MSESSLLSILVIGDLMLDRYWHGATSRISPEAPVPIVHVRGDHTSPGGVGNVALNIHALGGQVILLGVSGDDAAGDDLIRQLDRSGIELFIQRDPNIETIVKLRVMSKHQQLIRLDFEKKYCVSHRTALHADFQANVAKAKLVVLSDYGKGTLIDPQAFIQSATKAGVPVLVDPKGRNFSRYRGATILTPNYQEFCAVVGECESDEEMVAKAKAFLQDYDIEALLITRGAQGMSLFRQDDEYHLAALAHEVYDVTGAGDTVIAALAAALVAGKEMREAMHLANTAASIAVTHLGAVSVTQKELQTTLAHHQYRAKGILSAEQLSLAITRTRQRGERIILVHGCFDVIHSELIDLFQRAKGSGGRLLALVDEAADLHTQAQRMRVLAGLAPIDWVVSSSGTSFDQWITQIAPDEIIAAKEYEITGIYLEKADAGKKIAQILETVT
ncbi:MAG: D-glycero-beta-D-manno-heptose-7-phosphate kinase [Gammaproteobacteria bacterium]